MVKIRFVGADALMDGILLVRDQLGFEIAEEEAELICEVRDSKEMISAYSLGKGRAVITYGGGRARFFRALAGLSAALRGEGETLREERPLFKMNGTMMDVSRNAVMKPEKVKTLMRAMALMGMNAFMLYTEDTYTVPERPYFGYMRGRYTPEELRDMDRYGLKLGIELIPCVQFLGHLATTLRWQANADIKDTANVMLEGGEATYTFIGQMLREIKSCFTTKKLHMGMDETHDLGQGRHEEIFGHEDRKEIYFRHLKKVSAMAAELGLEPMMWSDMFFRMAAADQKLADFSDYDVRVKLPGDIGKLVPSNVTPVFWDYYNADEAFYASNLEKHKLFGRDTVFAGGIWCWGGFAPQFSRSFRNSLPALEACRKAGTTGVIATVWHNGSECSLLLSVAHLALYADYDYRRCYKEEGVRKTLYDATGEDYNALITAEEVEYPEDGNRDHGSSRPILYNDPLIGLFDKQIEGLDLKGYYTAAVEKLTAACEKTTAFTRPSMEVLLELARVLVNKADFGLRLKKAYDEKDQSALQAMAAECAVIRAQINTLRKAHRKQWMDANHAFGWEVHDVRYGALMMRFETCEERIRGYLAGESDAIEELEAERLYFLRPSRSQKLVCDWERFGNLFSANLIT